MKKYTTMKRQDLEAEYSKLLKEYDEYCKRGLSLDLSRGKPNSMQLDVSQGLMSVDMDKESCFSKDGVDCRNYGLLDGLDEMKSFFSELLGIKKEYIREAEAKRAVTIISAVLTVIMLVAIFSAFAVSMYVQFVGDEPKGGVAIPKVVLSDSMSRKRESNDYLEKHGLDDQFQTFDLIFIRELPGEFELELYDIVVYEYEDKLIIHRIIGIEEPNEKHPDCRHFLLRGDAAKFSDEFPVLYEQMKAIYEGQRIPFVGSFFAFMQSPAGYLCLLLIIFAVIATPIAEKKLWEAKLARLREIGFIPAEPEPTEAEATEEMLKMMRKLSKSQAMQSTK